MGNVSKKTYAEHGPFSDQWDWGKKDGDGNSAQNGEKFRSSGTSTGETIGGNDSLIWNVG